MIEKKPATGGKVKVTFSLPKDIAEKSVAIVGDFNDWNETKDMMKLDRKSGMWTKALTLKGGNAYQFRYFIDESQWRNEENADRSVPSPFFSENSVIEL